MSKHVLNPYPPESEWPGFRRFTICAPAPDVVLIEEVCPIRGTLTAIIHTVIKAIADELRANNINSYQPEAVMCQIRRLANPGTPAVRPDSDVGAGESRVRDNAATTAPSADAEKQPAKRSRGGKGSKAKGSKHNVVD